MKLDGKVCIVTGGASGIGHAIAQTFAEEDRHVVNADIDVDAAEKSAGELGDDYLGVAMDVADYSAVSSGVAAVPKRYGQIDVLVSNAGIQIVKPVEQIPSEDWKKVTSIRVDGGFLTLPAVLPSMYERGSGPILFMGPVHSREASALKAPYVAATHGLFKTTLVDKQTPEQAEDLDFSEEEGVSDVMLGETVGQEITTIEDVAAATLFFASFESTAPTGQSLIVSHGWNMK